MLDQIAAAFDRQDYKTAARLVRQLQQQSPDHPWVQFYTGRLQEVSGKLDAAEAIYRRLLKATTNPKLALQARQGLQRLEDVVRERRQEAIVQAKTDPTNAETGFLILEPLDLNQRQAVIPAFSRIMKLDAYTARVHLSHRSWRLYRTGAMGELQVYGNELQEAGIPAFWMPLSKVQSIRVFRVQYVQAVSPQPVVVCQNEANQLGTLAFDWSEVIARVDGRLPIFEDVVDVGAWNQLKRKEQTQDYVQIVDLHVPRRNCILRFCDRTYQFQQGVEFDHHSPAMQPLTHTTNRINWNNLLTFLRQRLPEVGVWSDFMPFAETAMEHLPLVKDLNAHIDLFRKQETLWDPAFHLYSSLVFLKHKPVQSRN